MTTQQIDYIAPYVADLRHVVRMDAIAAAGLKIGADPMGGAGVAFWGPIADAYGLAIDVVNPAVDPTFSFMSVDWDGKIRMDCSSPYAMAGLIGLKDRFDIAFGNDTDCRPPRHRHAQRRADEPEPLTWRSRSGICSSNRPGWRADAAIGKTLVSSSMIDRVAAHLGRALAEVPVGFKWFVDGLLDGSFGFGGEESAGASFLRQDGTVWTTDKDGYHPRSAGGRDHRRHRQRPGRALPRTGSAVRQRRSTNASTRRPTRGKRQCSAASLRRW